MYRGTLLIRNSAPLGPYSRTMPGPLWWSYGEVLFLMSEVPLCRMSNIKLRCVCFQGAGARGPPLILNQIQYGFGFDCENTVLCCLECGIVYPGLDTPLSYHGEVSRGEMMLYSGTDPESYITEYTLVYEDKTPP